MYRTVMRLYSQVLIIIFNQERMLYFQYNVNYVEPLIREYSPAAILIRLYFNDGSLLFIDANSTNEGINEQTRNGINKFFYFIIRC